MAEVKVSKMTANRVAITRTVLSSVEVNRDNTEAQLAKLLFPQGVPENLTLGMVIQAFYDLLAGTAKVLEDVDVRYKAEQADDAEPRTRREASVESLRKRIMRITEVMESAFGEEVAMAYGLGGETPEGGDELLAKAALIGDLLRERPLTEEPSSEGVSVSPAVMADEVSRDATAMRQALDDVKRESRELETALEDRDRAVETWRHHYQGVARIFMGLYTLIGEDELARRVRPTRRREAGQPERVDLGEGTEPDGQ